MSRAEDAEIEERKLRLHGLQSGSTIRAGHPTTSLAGILPPLYPLPTTIVWRARKEGT